MPSIIAHILPTRGSPNGVFKYRQCFNTIDNGDIDFYNRLKNDGFNELE